MAIREGAWDCPVCGRIRNRGPQKHCPGCGQPRGPEVPFYLPEDAPEVTDPQALEAATVGPDWKCNFCGADNRSDYEFCTGCGAGSDGATQRPVVEYRDPVEEEPKKPPKKKRGCRRLGCLGIAAAILGFFLLPGADEVELTVTGFAWERVAEIDALVTETEEAWQNQLPQGARVLNQWQEQRTVNQVPIGTETRTRTVTDQVKVGTERVKVGVRDLGNGFFEDIYEERPVYETVSREEEYEATIYRGDPMLDTRVRYEIDRWKPRREVRAQGRDRPGRWLEMDLAMDELVREVEDWYTVYFQGPEGKSFRWETRDENAWRALQQGSRYRAKAFLRSGKVTKVLGPV